MWAGASVMVQRGFHYIALGMLGLYFVGSYFVRELGVGKWEKPFLGSTLFILLCAALAHAAGLSKSQKDLELVKNSLSALTRVDAVEVCFFEGVEVYEATYSAIRAARKRVWVTYLRNEAPVRSDAWTRHLRACREWTFEDNSRRFRRIILEGGAAGMKEFCREELRHAVKADQRGYSYQVKILQDSVHSTEAFSVGIYDDMVFFTHRDGDHSIGIGIRSRKLADEYIRRYYDRLWYIAKKIEDIQIG
ncbi:hypothetical protein AB0M20_23780 [Actinoplanes sp. NPDC051633]|uniref:hypothetical protein n=1 Tax=Actinoplanes sp. NPDC051633 TaxID=3155670 RepID=UPI00342996F3